MSELTCPRCGAPVQYASDPATATMVELDATPSAEGTVALAGDPLSSERPRVVVLGTLEQLHSRDVGEDLYTLHSVTCSSGDAA